jgi:hypothetical protein
MLPLALSDGAGLEKSQEGMVLGLLEVITSASTPALLLLCFKTAISRHSTIFSAGFT